MHIGFIGFGEVASILSKPIRECGAEVTAFDILLEQDGGRAQLRKRQQADGIGFAPLAEVLRRAEYVISTVTTQVARQAAADCVGHLHSGQVFVDFNSTAPSVKVEMAAVIEPTGADFVEGAILGAVGATGAKTPILASGAKGEEVAATLSGLGLNVRYYSPEIGRASTFKMLRSIFSKGLEALILELLIAGRRAGIHEDLWADVSAFMGSRPFDQIASNWLRTHATAYERRYHEMVQVTETMLALGIDPVMTAGTEAFFNRSRALGLDDAFPEMPRAMDEVVAHMEKRLRKK